MGGMQPAPLTNAAPMAATPSEHTLNTDLPPPHRDPLRGADFCSPYTIKPAQTLHGEGHQWFFSDLPGSRSSQRSGFSLLLPPKHQAWATRANYKNWKSLQATKRSAASAVPTIACN